MDDLLEPGESVVYRGRPGCRTAAIAIACGFGFAAAIHIVVGTIDDNWTCPASLMWLAVLAPFGAILIARTARARLILTDRRVLYRRNSAVEVEHVALADIRAATLSFPEFLPAMKISRRDGEDMTVKYIARLEELCHRVRTPDGFPPASPQTMRGAVLIVTAAFGASLGLWLGMFGIGSLILQEPTGTIDAIRAWRESPEFTDRMLGKIALVVTLLVLVGPILAGTILGAWLGYLPALLASRLLISFEEARHLALVPRRMATPFDLSGDSELPEDEEEGKRAGWIFKITILWPMFWAVLTITALAALTDRLATLVFGRTVLPDEAAAI